jgi:hypothetical protein
MSVRLALEKPWALSEIFGYAGVRPVLRLTFALVRFGTRELYRHNPNLFRVWVLCNRLIP